MKFKADLKILATHPVQYQVPLFRALLAQGLKVEVGYYHQGAAGRVAFDSEFGLDLQWDLDLLSGYPYRIFYPHRPAYGLAEQARVAGRVLPWALADRKVPLLLIGWGIELMWLLWALRLCCQAPTFSLTETTPLSFGLTAKPGWRLALLRRLLQKSAACLYIGARNRDFLIGQGVREENLFYVPYSIDNAGFAAAARQLSQKRRQLCDRFGLDPELPTLLFCGKLIPKKRPLQLLEAYLAAGLKDRAQLIYVGDGALRSRIADRAGAAGARRVHLLGFFNQTQMPLAYVLGEILCLPSDPGETWGLVVNEALACGRPVIVADSVGCAPDLVRPENGWVVPLDDAAALAATLVEALAARARWPGMGEAGRKIVAHHTFAAMAAGVRAAVLKSAEAGCPWRP